MTFPCVELKFSRVVRNVQATLILARVYRVDDGGIVNGVQQFIRTRLRQRMILAPPDATKAEVVTKARQKLLEWARQEGYNLTPDRLICTL
jgi:hypothetical protein